MLFNCHDLKCEALSVGTLPLKAISTQLLGEPGVSC